MMSECGVCVLRELWMTMSVVCVRSATIMSVVSERQNGATSQRSRELNRRAPNVKEDLSRTTSVSLRVGESDADSVAEEDQFVKSIVISIIT